MQTYEAMLLVEPTIASREWPRVIEEIERLAKKNGAAVLQVAKWRRSLRLSACASRALKRW